MPVKVIYVAGVPACGKTTLFKRLREHLFANPTVFKQGKVRGIESECKIFKMLGVFDGSTFEGTDRLSMTVIDDAIEYVRKLSIRAERYVVFVEGDRLFNFRFLSESKANLFLLDANPEVLQKRHYQRGDNQTEAFLRSRRSKVENFANKHNLPRHYNNTPEDSDRIFHAIIKTAQSWITEPTCANATTRT